MKHKLFLFTFLLAILSAINIQASERKKYNFNSEWKLRIGDFPKAKDTKFDDRYSGMVSQEFPDSGTEK